MYLQKVVLFARYSTDMQNPKSCDDQSRDVRAGLARKGIDATNALVIHEDGESGTRSDRAGFGQIVEMVARKETFLLAVDDQSRFSRADNVFSFITDLVFVGGRFISTGEGIDTNEVGWELRVKVMELHNSTTIRETGRRVHRGQLGRVLDDKSAGDTCFGFESYFIDPDWAQKMVQRGPKPVKGIRIHEAEARWVRQIFEWFVKDLWSINKIARELTKLKVSKGRRSGKAIWHHHQVRRILANPKYVGKWSWGATRTIRNSRGKVRQVPVPEDRKAVRERPDLRIIAQDLWERAQQRLLDLTKQFGMQPGQKRRGPRVHYSVEYPQGLLRGLVVCSVCQRRLWQQGRGGKYFLACPDSGEGGGLCPMRTRVPLEAAEDAVLKILTELFEVWPDWISRAIAAMRSALELQFQLVPAKLADEKRHLRELEEAIVVILNRLESPEMRPSEALNQRLSEREAEAAELKRSIQAAEEAVASSVEFPNEQWIRQQLKDIPGLFREDQAWSGRLLRRLIGRIEASAVVAPGKKRGYSRLTFDVNAWDVILVALEGRVPEIVARRMRNSATAHNSPKFVIDLGHPGRMEEWAPKIAEMRAAGVTWKEITKITGLGLGPAYETWRRYTRAVMSQNNEEGGPDKAAG
jgi:site-specific DNA recombinase